MLFIPAKFHVVAREDTRLLRSEMNAFVPPIQMLFQHRILVTLDQG